MSATTSMDRSERDRAVREAQRQATELSESLGLTSLPVDPFLVAERSQISVRRGVEHLGSGRLGATVFSAGRFGIELSSEIDNSGLLHFTLSHELGHCHLEGHAEYLLGCGGRHVSTHGSDIDDLREREADTFAAELLMPQIPCGSFLEETHGRARGLSAIAKLGDRCAVTLHAAANRYVELAAVPAAIIVSQDNKVCYCMRTKAFRSLLGQSYRHPKKGSPLRSGCLASVLHENPRRIDSWDELGAERVKLVDWFGVDAGFAQEECIGLGKHGRKALTVISVC